MMRCELESRTGEGRAGEAINQRRMDQISGQQAIDLAASLLIGEDASVLCIWVFTKIARHKDGCFKKLALRPLMPSFLGLLLNSTSLNALQN